MSIKHLAQCLASTKWKIIGSCSYFKTTIITFYWLHQLIFDIAALKGKKIALPNKDRYELLSHVKKHKNRPGHTWWLCGVIKDTQDVIFVPLPRQLLPFSRSPHGPRWLLKLKPAHLSLVSEGEKERTRKKGTPWSWVRSLKATFPWSHAIHLLPLHLLDLSYMATLCYRETKTYSLLF